MLFLPLKYYLSVESFESDGFPINGYVQNSQTESRSAYILYSLDLTEMQTNVRHLEFSSRVKLPRLTPKTGEDSWYSHRHNDRNSGHADTIIRESGEVSVSPCLSK
jgi:hypothetical protein